MDDGIGDGENIRGGVAGQEVIAFVGGVVDSCAAGKVDGSTYVSVFDKGLLCIGEQTEHNAVAVCDLKNTPHIMIVTHIGIRIGRILDDVRPCGRKTGAVVGGERTGCRSGSGDCGGDCGGGRTGRFRRIDPHSGGACRGLARDEGVTMVKIGQDIKECNAAQENADERDEELAKEVQPKREKRL